MLLITYKRPLRRTILSPLEGSAFIDALTFITKFPIVFETLSVSYMGISFQEKRDQKYFSIVFEHLMLYAYFNNAKRM